jgi:predicted porin
MTKKLLPTMIGTVLIGGMSAASADVSVFGHIDAAISNIDAAAVGATPAFDDTNFTCTTCSIGFKGSEDLGNGLKAIFKLDFQYDIFERNRASDGNDSLFDRDQWVGLKGGFGQVRAGTISTVYKSHGAMIDPLYRTALQGRDHGLQSNFHTGANEEGRGRATNTVRWDSANFNGLKLGAHYTLDTGKTPEDDNPFGIGASYSNGGILAFADYLTTDGSVATGNDIDAWKLGGKYSMDNIAVMGQYEDADRNGAETQHWHIAGTFTMGNNMIYAGYGNAETENTAGATTRDIDAWTIALMHSMSKRTKAYVGYNNQEDDVTNSEYDEFSVGIKHKF